MDILGDRLCCESVDVGGDRFTAVFDQTRHKMGRRAKPRNGFYILLCGGFESKVL
jgi:hypothetical protein